MQFRSKSLSLVAVGLTAAVVGPALAFAGAAPTATIEARDDGTGSVNWFQDGSQASPTDSSVTVTVGDSVTFKGVAPATGNAQFHNVSFDKSALKPASCNLPGVKQAPWEGSCTFTAPGEYSFYCQVHPTTMTGTVIVEKAPDPTPTATPTETATAVPTFSATPAPTAVPTPVPTVAPESEFARLDAPSKPKTATFVKSGLKLKGPCANIASGKVTLAVTKAVAKKLKLKSTTLGTGTGRCNAGEFSVTVKPSAAVKKALKKHKGSISATATLKADKVTATRKVTLK